MQLTILFLLQLFLLISSVLQIWKLHLPENKTSEAN